MARRHPNRSKSRAQRLDEAREVQLPSVCDVCVVGGGASGLAAAIAAAEAGARVVVLERDAECGRTILATGNGRCNFANTHLDWGRYNSPDFVRSVAGESFLGDVLAFFRTSGLIWAEEDGRLYPQSRQAASVRNVLLARAMRAGVLLAAAREAVLVTPSGRGFVVRYAERFEGGRTLSLGASSVILASGGRALAPVARVGLEMRPMTPVLCALACSGKLFSKVDGRRAHVDAALIRNDALVAREPGEVLFRTYGVSGIVAFDLSRIARPGDTLELDLVPGTTEEELSGLLRSGLPLDGFLDPVIAELLRDEERDTSPKDLPQVFAYDVKHLDLRVEGKADEAHAQVTRGGLANDQFAPSTLECRRLPGLFACGEALDVDGACGGFNLAWAWKSGLVAGSAAARRAGEQ